MTHPGQLRESIALSKRSLIDDGYGNEVTGPFEVQATVPARVVGMKGQESVVAGRLQGIQPYVITIRNAGPAASVTTEWKATNTRSGVEYAIRSIIVDERGDYADLLCETGVAV